MRQKQAEIVTLVRSLTTVEKQQFKKRFKMNSDYTALFDYINKTGHYSYEGARAYLQKRNPGKNSYSSGHLSVLLDYLREKIMDSLRTQYSIKRSSYEVLTRCLNADIMLEKGLYKQAQREIQTAKKKCLERSFPIERLLLQRRESLLMFYDNYEGTNMSEIDLLYENRLSSADQLLREIQYARILTVLSYQYFKGERNERLLRSFMAENYMRDPDGNSDFGPKYLYHWVRAQFAEFTNQPKQAIRHFEQAIQVWLEHPKYIEAHPRMYLGACFTYLKYMLQQNRFFDQNLEFFDFSDLLHRLFEARIFADESDQYEQLFLVGQMLTLRKAMRFHEITKMAPSLGGAISGTKRASTFIRILIRYVAATAYFEQGNYRRADEILSKMISQEFDLKNNPEYHSLTYMLSLLTQYEQKHFRHLKYLLRDYRRRLQQDDQFGEVVITFFKMVSQLISERYKNNREAVFKRYHKKLKHLLEDAQLQNDLEHGFILAWVAKKENEAA